MRSPNKARHKIGIPIVYYSQNPRKWAIDVEPRTVSHLWLADQHHLVPAHTNNYYWRVNRFWRRVENDVMGAFTLAANWLSQKPYQKIWYRASQRVRSTQNYSIIPLIIIYYILTIITQEKVRIGLVYNIYCDVSRLSADNMLGATELRRILLTWHSETVVIIRLRLKSL